MAMICPQCQTKNRSAAKFCIECIGSLPTGFAPDSFAFTADRPTTTTATAPTKPPLIGIAALGIALAIGASGWLAAGAGGWYLYAAGKSQVDPPRIEEPASPPSTATLFGPMPAITAPEPATNAPLGSPAAASTSSTRVSAQAPRTALKSPERPPPAKAEPTAAPAAACTEMNFFSAARCMAAQCAKPEFKAHAQCDAVRARQRLEEEKRNPPAP